MESLLGELDFASSPDQTGSSSSNKTALLSTWGVSTGGSGVTNVLMVTTTMRMLDWVHGYTSYSWPVSLLSVRFVVRIVCLKKRLVGSLSSSYDADHGSAVAKDGLSHTRWHSDTGLLSVLSVSNDDGAGSRCTGETATISHLGFDIGDDGAFRHGINWKNVANCEGSY